MNTNDCISIHGARQNNLKGIDVKLPLGELIVVTGVSGSGKSSLAFDTVYAEGQRRYVETFSPYARQFLERMDKPQADRIDGIPPAIAIDQTNPVRTSRSTVGTMTELNDHLKLLFARAARLHCHGCDKPVRRDSPATIFDQVVAHFASLTPAPELLITFPVPIPKSFSLSEVRSALERQGYTRILHEDKTALEVIQTRGVFTPARRQRLCDDLEAALKHGQGRVTVWRLDPATGKPLADSAPRRFSSGLHCPDCDIAYSEPTPNLFSFNSPIGACDTCRGFGRIIGVDYGLVVPDPTKTPAGGAIRPWQTASYSECQEDLLKFARKRHLPMNVPWCDMPEEHRRWVLDGEGAWEDGLWYGVKRFFEWLETKAYKMHIRVLLSKYRSYQNCPVCGGARLKPESLNWRLGPDRGLNIHDVMLLPIDRLQTFFRELQLPAPLDEATSLLLTEIHTRLSYLVDVGLGYLTLDRQSRTLSGGEVQRINLTTALGTSLVNTLFVLDEPSIGLHSRDIRRLIHVLHRLRDAGNTLLVVEHDPEVILAADRVLDLGPGPGEKGGEIVFYGDIPALCASRSSLTGAYLTGRQTIAAGTGRAVDPAGPHLELLGAAEHNLKNVDVRIPLQRLVCITGVSGSGKSTLVQDVLYNGLRKLKHKPADAPGLHRAIRGAEALVDVVLVDQSPIGKTTRSNPASYVGAFDAIRKLFAEEDLAAARGYTAGTFSFNCGNGRCPTCSGNGFQHVEMQFLSDVYLRCPDCDGKRFRPEVLEVKLRGDKSIADVLELTVSEACVFFADEPAVLRGLKPLRAVGLDYLKLGQPVPTLSGGEAQRLKLAGHLAESGDSTKSGQALFLFDEPTTGLHFADIATLLTALRALVARGHSVVVIEHNLDVIRAADWILDLGPEGGDAGGQLLFAGTPAALLACANSYTAAALRGYSAQAGALPLPTPAGAEPAPGPGLASAANTAPPAAEPAGGALPSGEAPEPPASGRPGSTPVVLEGERPASRTSASRVSFTKSTSQPAGAVGGLGGTPDGHAAAAGSAAGAAALAVPAKPGPGAGSAPGGLEAEGASDRPGPAGAAQCEARRAEPLMALRAAARHSIVIHNAREHNLRGVELQIPRDKFTVITGISGSGKSTVAFDILFAEGQRRYLESLNAYARQFVQPASRADVDAVLGVPPTVAIEQRTSRGGRKSTVATVTEIYHFLRLLFVKLGTQYCPDCNVPIEPQSPAAILARLQRDYKGATVSLLAPLVTARKGYYTDLAKWAGRKGFTHLRVDGELLPVQPWPRLDRFKEHSIQLPVAEIRVSAATETELRLHLTTALAHGKGVMHVLPLAAPRQRKGAAVEAPVARVFSTKRACHTCGRSFEELDPRLFSYNSKHGWCPKCYGTGMQLQGFNDEQTGEEIWWNAWWEGPEKACPACAGRRLRPEALAVRFQERTIAEFAAMPVVAAAAHFAGLKLRGREAEIARDIVAEIGARLGFLHEVGLSYLALDRAAPTLSGGEAQRIRLAAQLGSNLRGVCYILDEPTIGLHARDNRMLLNTLRALEAKGNTVVVVEHDEETIRQAEHVIDLGPGAGVNGGRLVAAGTLKQLMKARDSITGRCLREPLRHPLMPRRPTLLAAPGKGRRAAKAGAATPTACLEVQDATLHNLHGLSVQLPLGRLVCVTGVSGSGKSTLVRNILHDNLHRLLGDEHRKHAKTDLWRAKFHGCERILGAECLRRVLEVDQTPIGKTPRSCPATYIGFWDDIRRLFAATPEARMRGWGPGRFSFNVKGGRCEACEGQGMKKIEMSFLPDVAVPCEVCRGRRFNPETLAVHYREKTVAEVLLMSVDEAVDVFAVHGPVHRPLLLLQEVGLGYLTLGQQSPTLSGGEAQRIKLVTELAKAGGLTGGQTLYILDEPTIGLHMADVEKLIRVLHRLVDAGHTVIIIEHNLDIIAECDWVVDLGPEGGDGGGQLVAQGTPEQVAAVTHGSHTGAILGEFLKARRVEK